MSRPVCFVTSDLHLGAPYSRYNPFLEWLDSLPKSVPLVLNGDTLNWFEAPLLPAEQQVLDRLAEASYQRQVVWLSGNRDPKVIFPNRGKIIFGTEWAVGRRLLIIHGDRFDAISPKVDLLKDGVQYFFRLLTRVGYPDQPMSQTAKRWTLLYSLYNRYIAKKAAAYARKRGFRTVACGHTHHVADMTENGVRYLNTGTWMEARPHCLVVEADAIRLVRLPGD